MPSWTGAAATLRWRAGFLMMLSGFAALSYQIIWTQQLSTWLGHEVGAVLAVMAAFFFGLALGGWTLGPRAARSPRPGLWLAALEAVVGLWALLLVLGMPAAGAWLMQAQGADSGPWRQAFWAFFGTALLLLPATAAMGATLPALQRVLAPLRDAGHGIGGLYAANTAGAMAGALLAAFWLAPSLGLRGSAAVAAGASLLCAVLAWWWLDRPPMRSPAIEDAATDRAPAGSAGVSARGEDVVGRATAPLWRLAATGCLGIGVEVLVVRVLSQVAENTVYTYALLLAVYLLGTAAGAALYQRWLARPADPARRSAQLLAATALACVAAGLVLAQVPQWKPGWAGLLSGSGELPGFEATLAAEALLALAALALPSLAMGALFSHLAVRAHDAGWPLGTALAANTLGAAAAAPLVGVSLLPLLGPGGLLAGMAASYLLLMPRPGWRSPWPWLAGTSTAAMLLAGPSLRHVQVPPEGRVLSHLDGVLAAVSVIEDASGVRTLHINNREQEGSSATRVADARQAWLPLLLHPQPQRLLFLGLGTGVTATSALAPGLQVEAVELLPEVVQAAAHFVPAQALSSSRQPGTLKVHVADARRHVRVSRQQHDVIVADLFHPARSGAGALFTTEHFAAVRERLAPQGLFCQWLPVHQMDIDSLRSVVAAFLQVYPQAVAVLATHSLDTPVLGLVGRADDGPWTAHALAARLAAARSNPLLSTLQLDDPWAVVGSVLADADALARFAGQAVPNRDDRPIVSYRAPRLRNTATEGPRQRLAQLVQRLHAEPERVFGLPDKAADAQWQQRLAAYWQARDHYLLAGMRVQPTSDLPALLAQVQEPLLATLRISPDFRSAYDPLLRMARALAPTDAEGARALLLALQQLQPGRPEAQAALTSLRDLLPTAHPQTPTIARP